MRRTEVDAVVRRPAGHRGPLAHAPDERALQSAGVAPVTLGVAGGDDAVEAEGVGQGRDQVDGRGGGQDQTAALAAVCGQRLEGPGLDEVHERLDGALPRPPGGLCGPVAHGRGRGPGQADEGDRLTEPVVEPVHEAVPGQVAPRREHALGLHGLVEDGSTGRPDQGPVQIDEDGTGGRHALTLPPAGGARATAGRVDAKRPPDAAKGPPGGRRSLCTDSTRIGGGFLTSCGLKSSYTNASNQSSS